MRRTLVGTALGLVIAVITFGVRADPPSGSQPTQPAAGTSVNVFAEFTVTADAGAWLICAASYSGVESPELGHELVLQIRRQYKVAAYTFNRGEEERKKQNEEFENLEKQQLMINPLVPVRKRHVRIEDQVAVLVGGYPDDKSARRALDTVKKWQPPQLRMRSGLPALDTVFISRDDGKTQERETVNPFTAAFVTRNPVLPRPTEPDVNPLWAKLNRNEEFSLLQCPQPITLLVKQYAGAGGLVQGEANDAFLKKLGSSSYKTGAALDAAGMQAHELARVLRQLNFKAYVLHTRTCSLVTVGAFKDLKDPAYQRVKQQLAALQERLAATGSDPFHLNPNPAPMAVPR